MNENNPDGLRYPSIDELLKVIDSKYKLAYTAAKRAKIIKEEDYSSLDDEGGTKCDKPVGKALEEILAGKIKIEFAPYTSAPGETEEVIIDDNNPNPSTEEKVVSEPKEEKI